MASFIIGGSAVAAASAIGTTLIKGDYTTLSNVRTYLSLASADISDNDELRRFITRASRSIDGFTRRAFYPRRIGDGRLLTFDLPNDRSYLRMDGIDLLEVKGLSDLNGASEVDSNVYWLKTGDIWNATPYDRIIIDDSSGSQFSYSRTPQKAIHVDAIVGYHNSYERDAWVDSGASLTYNIGVGTTMASVSASGEFNTLGIAPRFSEGQLWKIGNGTTEEFVYVKDTVSSSTVRIIRGVNGTSAFSHSVTTPIYTWQPERDIEFAATELTAFMYQKSKSPFTNRAMFPQLGIIEQPEAWPEQTLDRLTRFKKNTIYSF